MWSCSNVYLKKSCLLKYFSHINWFVKIIRRRSLTRESVAAKLNLQNKEIAALCKMGVMTKEASQLLTQCNDYQSRKKIINIIIRDYASYCKFHSHADIHIRKIHIIGVPEIRYFLYGISKNNQLY